MAVTNNAVLGVALGYIEANPAELETVRDLVVLALHGPPVTLRSTTPAHVTCRAVVVTSDWRILQIRSAAAEPWRLPGGHLQPGDSSLLGSALRWLTEMTGIDSNTVRPDSALPCDVDVQAVDAVPVLGEPEHVHYDVRFLLHVTSRETAPAPGDSVRWSTIAAVGGSLGAKLRISSRTAGAVS